MAYELDLDPPFVIQGPRMTERQYYARVTRNEDSRWELLDGRVFVSVSATDLHEDIFRFLLALLSNFLDERPLGVVRGSRYPMRLGPKWSPEPDILFVSRERQHLRRRKRLEGPADLAIEIVSETCPELDYDTKRSAYRRHGVREIWLVDPRRRTITVDVAGDGEYETRVLSSGRLASAVVTGFWIDVGWLWRKKLPPAFRCAMQILRRKAD